MYPTKPLWEICDIQNWYAFKTSDYTEISNIRLIRIWNVQKWFIWDKSPCFILEEIFQNNQNFHLKENDLLISLTWDVWRVWFFPKELLPALLNQRVGRFFDFSNEIDMRYLFHFLNTKFFEEKVIKTSSWAAQKNTSTSKIKQIQIPLPPLPTQQKIVSKLDNIFENIDKNIELTKQNITNIDEENNAILEKIFKECEKEFGVEKLGEICDIVWWWTPRTNILEYWADEIIWLSPTDLPEVWKIIEIEDSSKKISKLWLEKSSAKLLPIWTVIFSSRATIWKIAINTKELSTNQGFSNFICSEKIFNKFLAYALRNFTKEIIWLSNSTTFKEVNKTNLKNFQIPLPPLPNQQKIVEKLDNIFAKNSELKNFYEKNLKNLEELKQSILKQAFEDENFIK